MQATQPSEVRVVLTSLEDDSEQGIERFARDLAQTFKISLDKAQVIARKRPYTVKSSCDPEMAERLAHTLGRLGGITEIQPVGAPARPDTMPTSTPPVAAAQQSPAEKQPGASTPPPGPGSQAEAAEETGTFAPLSALPLQTGAESPDPTPVAAEPVAAEEPGTLPPLGPTPVAEAVRSSVTEPAVEAPKVQCTECGTLQPASRKDCETCHFPLPSAARSTVGEAQREETVEEKSTSDNIVVFSDVADGFGELQQCAPPVYTAAGLLIVTALLNLWSMAFFSDVTGTSGMISSFIDLGLAFGLLKGSRAARTWVLVRAVIGGFLWGLIALGTGDFGWFLFQEMYSVSLIVLLLGRGSLLKAVLVGVPNAMVLGVALAGMIFLSMAGALPGGGQASGLVIEANRLQEEARFDEAIALYREALNQMDSASPDAYQATVYRNLGSAYMGKQDYIRAIPEFQASAALDDGNADTHYLLALSHFQVGQNQQAMDELLRVKELDPDYPNLESSIEAVARSGARHRY